MKAVPDGPPVPRPGTTIVGALKMVNSHPALIAGWLFISLFGLAFSQILNLIEVSPWLKIPLLFCWWLLYFFFFAGFMGSFDIMLNLGSWNPLAVLESGKHYFWRFVRVGIVEGIIVLIPVALGVVLVLLLASGNRPVYFSVVIMSGLAGIVIVFFLIFAYAGVVVEEANAVAAVFYSCRVVRTYPLQTLSLLVIFSGFPVLFSLLTRGLQVSSAPLAILILNNLFAAYGGLLLMAGLVYFSVALKRIGVSGK